MRIHIYCLQQTFISLPNDMENYMEYHVMGSVPQVRMEPGCMPTKFTCQPDRKTQTSNTTERPYIVKKRRMMILEECDKQFEESTIVKEPSSSKEIASCSSVQQIVEEVPQLPPRMLDKAIQVHICETFRSKANQTKVNLVNQMTSPLKPCLHSVSTSPFKIKHDVNSNPSRPTLFHGWCLVSYPHDDRNESSIIGLAPTHFINFRTCYSAIPEFVPEVIFELVPEGLDKWLYCRQR
ncbi:hypothetical protein EVAR_60188_1 [Eumeta japonica]|uniref:Uncharacterized protein n=1 Tax=Eumeta variegata TaxID=151549 RepID=A0A4C1SC51_EUMVA|nr:hypothetical protein EVAR_60188_1 [Eumeta japonica]